MPRPRHQLELEVLAYDGLVPGQPYPMKVVAIEKKAANSLAVLVEHLASEQAGRQHTMVLRLPCRPQSPSARFFAALGLDTSVGCRIRPAEAVGRALLVVFGPSSEGEEPQPVAFHPIQEKHHAQHAE